MAKRPIRNETPSHVGRTALMDLIERRAIEFTPDQLANAVNRCFEGYIQTFTIDGRAFERRFRPEGLDTEASLLLFQGDAPAAICLIARRGWTCRVAAMAIAPAFRGKRVGQGVMCKMIDEARTRGDRRMVLEVIEQNPPAIGLYESVGMRKTRRLVGYRREPAESAPAKLSEIDPVALTRLMAAECDPDLPWDYLPETLSAKVPPTVAYSLDDKAFALVTDSPVDKAVIWSLFTRRDSRRQGYGSKMVLALAARLPGKTLLTPIALPDTLAPEFFVKHGFKPVDISQFEMAIELV